MTTWVISLLKWIVNRQINDGWPGPSYRVSHFLASWTWMFLLSFLCSPCSTEHWNLNPYPMLHQTTIWWRCGTTQHDKGWLKSYENIFPFSNTITCDKTDFYLRWLNGTGAITLFISTMVQGLTLATLSTLWKQLWRYEKFPAITITAWHVLKSTKWVI